jgi:ribosome-associated protein
MIGDGDVLVDGEIETRRGRQLAKGMVVEVRTASQTLVAKVG